MSTLARPMFYVSNQSKSLSTVFCFRPIDCFHADDNGNRVCRVFYGLPIRFDVVDSFKERLLVIHGVTMDNGNHFYRERLL